MEPPLFQFQAMGHRGGQGLRVANRGGQGFGQFQSFQIRQLLKIWNILHPNMLNLPEPKPPGNRFPGTRPLEIDQSQQRLPASNRLAHGMGL